MDLSAYKQVAAVEKHHWYFVARRNILAKILSRLVPTPKKTQRVLDIGIGTGATVDVLQPYGTVTGIEYIDEGLKYTRQNVDQSIGLLQASGDMLPFKNNAFNLVTAFDVIEHIPNDQGTMDEIWRVLDAQGAFFGLVPAHPWLWSDFDTLSHHQRRYTKEQLQAVVQQAGFKVRYCFYTHSIIFIPVVLLRGLRGLLKKLFNIHLSSSGELAIPPRGLNTLLTRLCSLESHILPHRPMPFGVSLVIFATKD